MGCSSSSITDNGEFEPRASVSAGELWGLWEANVQEEKFGKGKERKGDVEVARKGGSKKKRCVEQKEMVGTGDEGAKIASHDGEKRSLVESVRRSRSACYLRYLNGAAFVVYGIPVYMVD